MHHRCSLVVVLDWAAPEVHCLIVNYNQTQVRTKESGDTHRSGGREERLYFSMLVRGVFLVRAQGRKHPCQAQCER